MSTPLLTFFATHFRIPKHKLFQSSTDDLEDVFQAQEAEDADQQDEEQDQSDIEEPTWTISDHKNK